MTIAVIPGTFDPVTLGHIDLMNRAASFVDRVVVGVGNNMSKTPMFTINQRIDLVRRSLQGCEHAHRITVEEMVGTTIDFCVSHSSHLIIKGIRSESDVPWESSQASVNRDVGGIETVLLPTLPCLTNISSSIVRELIHWQMDITRYVPPPVAAFVADNRGSVGNVGV